MVGSVAGGWTVISVAPGTLARSVLELVVARPGELDAEAIAARLLPGPKWSPPYPATHQVRSASYEAWLLAERGPATPDRFGRMVRRGGRQATATAQVSRALGRLQERGLVETRGAPILDPGWPQCVSRYGLEGALRNLLDEDQDASLVPHMAILGRVGKGPAVSDLLGADPSGTMKRAYKDLVDWGVLIPPSYRWPTAAGIDLVLGATTPAEAQEALQSAPCSPATLTPCRPPVSASSQ